MLYNQGNNQPPLQEVEPRLTWLDYLILSSPQAVMQVLAKNGYVGYLAPVDQSELSEVIYDFVEQKGDYAVTELLKAHPLYDVIVGISKEETRVPITFKNAAGDEYSVVTTLKTIDYKKVIETLLVIVGTFYIADRLLSYFNK
jgi:hypothetical protein